MQKKILSVLTSLFIAAAPLGVSAAEETIDNLFSVNYQYSGSSISAVLGIDGTVCIGGFEAVLNYDADKYAVESSAKKNADILMNVIPSKGEIVISMAANSNLADVSDLINVEFSCSETPAASDFHFEITDAYMITADNNLEDVTCSIKENWSGLGETETTTTTAVTTTATAVTTTTAETTSTSAIEETTTAVSTTTTTETTAASATTETTTAQTTAPDKISAKNNFVISVTENKETNQIEVSLLVNGEVEFLTAEGSIGIHAAGLGDPVLLSSVPDALASYKAEDNSIYFTVISSTGENITESQTVFTYAFPIENPEYDISCTGKITDICDQNYNDAEYAVSEKNEVSSQSPAETTATTAPAETAETTGMTESSASDPDTGTTTVTTAVSGTENTETAETSTTESTISAAPYELSNWAENDYYQRTGIAAYRSEYTETADGTVIISIFDEQGNVLDTYTVHSKTGKGFNSSGDEVNLPQTGNNSLAYAAGAAGAFIMITAGACAVKLSGITGRKKNEQ